ncbi:MAG: ATP-binding protein [Candidatus Altiarchaeota archaeon]|nr:ATP-binding protein [Candidatus Altiarchaeota archaeon]
MQEIGRIIGTTSLTKYIFAVSKEGEKLARKDDFVSAVEPISKKEVVGIIKGITASNQLLPDEFARESIQLSEYMRMYDFGEGEYLVGIVDILGHLDGDSLKLPKYSLRPASQVFLTKDETLKKLMNVDEKRSVHIGSVEARQKVDVYLDLNRLIGMHSAILAMTGAGKSYTGGVLIEEVLKKGGSVVVFDPHGEYKYLGYKSDGSKSGIFDKVKVLGVGKNSKNNVKIRADRLTPEDIASLIPGTTETQKNTLHDIIEICEVKKRSYNLQDLIELLHMVMDRKGGEENGEEVLGSVELDGRIDKISKKAHLSTVSALIRRLDGLRRFNIISDTETSLEEMVSLDQATIIDLSGTSESIKETVVSALSRKIFHARMNYINDYGDEKLDIPCLLVVEEAHNFVPREYERPIVSRGILRRIAREGRKFGVGLCLISQRPSRLDQDVLSQCNTQIIMKIVNPLDQDYIRKSAEAVTEDVIRDLPSLGRGEAIITGAAINFPMHVKIKERDTKPGGMDIDIIAEWDGKNKNEA